MFENVSHSEIKRSSEKTFGYFFSILFLIYSFYPLIYNGEIIIWAFVTSFILLIITYKFVSLLIIPNKIWIKLGLLLGYIISPVVFFAIYVITFYPIGFIIKIFKFDILNKKIDVKKETYWIKRVSKMQSLKRMY